MPSSTVGVPPASVGAGARNRALCAAWLDWLGHRGRKPLTVYQYAGKLDDLCAWAAGRPFDDMAIVDLEGWVNRPRSLRARGAEGSASTKAKDVIVLRGLYGWACSHGHLAHNPTADMRTPTVRNHNPRAIPPGVWAKVWCSELSEEERVVLGLGFFCGLRREEICRLRAEHFDLDQGRIIHFPRKGDVNDKNTGVFPYLSCSRLFGEKRPDLIGMPESFLSPLSAVLSRADTWLIPWGQQAVYALRRRPDAVGPPEGMTNPDQINARVKRLLRRLGQPEGLFTPHALRHSFVTYLLEMSVPLEVVSKLANHSTPTITMRYVRIANDPLARFLSDAPLQGSRW